MVRAEGFEPSWSLVVPSAARVPVGCVYQFRHARWSFSTGRLIKGFPGALSVEGAIEMDAVTP